MSSRSKSVEVQLIVRDDCPCCDQVQDDLWKYCESRGFISLKVMDLDKGDTAPNGKQSYIVPAIWVNERLWSLGGFDIDRFDRRINQLLKKISM